MTSRENPPQTTTVAAAWHGWKSVDSMKKQKTHPKHKFDSEWVDKPMQTHQNYDANI